MFHAAVHHRAGVHTDQRVKILIAALDGALEQGAGKLAGVVGHVVGRDVDGAGLRGAKPCGEAVVNVQQNLGHVETGITQADAAVVLGLPDQLVVGFVQKLLKIDQMLQVFQMVHLFFPSL